MGCLFLNDYVPFVCFFHHCTITNTKHSYSLYTYVQILISNSINSQALFQPRKDWCYVTNIFWNQIGNFYRTPGILIEIEMDLEVILVIWSSILEAILLIWSSLIYGFIPRNKYLYRV